MYLKDLLDALRRRWYVIVIGLLATVGLVSFAATLAPVEYVAKSSVLLLPPQNTVGAGGNPYLALGGLQAAADVLARAMTDTATVAELAPPQGTASYTVEPDATTNSPMLVIKSTDASPAGSLKTLSAVLVRAPAVLRGLQKEVGAPADALINLSTITHDTIAQADYKNEIRLMVVAAALGLAVSFFGASLLDGFLIRRASSRADPRELDVREVGAHQQPPKPPADRGYDAIRERAKVPGAFDDRHR